MNQKKLNEFLQDVLAAHAELVEAMSPRKLSLDETAHYQKCANFIRTAVPRMVGMIEMLSESRPAKFLETTITKMHVHTEELDNMLRRDREVIPIQHQEQWELLREQIYRVVDFSNAGEK